jgi:hypothetical protein
MRDTGQLPPLGAGQHIQAGGPKGAKEPSGLLKLVRAIANALGAVFRALIPGRGIGKKATEGAPDQRQAERIATVTKFIRGNDDFQAFETATSSDSSSADRLKAIRDHFTKVNKEIATKNIKGLMQLEGPYIARAAEVLDSLPADLDGLEEMKKELGEWKEEHELFASPSKRVAVTSYPNVPKSKPTSSAHKSPAPVALTQAEKDARVRETEAYKEFEAATDSSKPYVERFQAAKNYLDQLHAKMRTMQLRGVYQGQKPFLDRVGEVLRAYDGVSSISKDVYEEQCRFLEEFIAEYETFKPK